MQIRRKLLRLICALRGHNWKCMSRKDIKNAYNADEVVSTCTGWCCFRCRAERIEQWDW